MSPFISPLLCLLLVAPSGPRPAVELEAQAAAQGATTPQPDQVDQQPPADAAIDAPDKPPTPPHTGSHAILRGLRDDIKHLPSTNNLLIAVIGGGLALGAHPFDQRVNARAIGQSDLANKIFAAGKFYGNTPEQIGLSLGTWALGRVMDKPKISHLGMDLLRAQAVTEILVEPVKLLTHRARPDNSDHMSFPSGHTAITFAAAAVIQRHLGWRDSLLPYAIASYVAASRLHDNRHYLSDVVFGAAVGSLAGRTVTAHGRDTWTLTSILVPGGVGVGVTRAAN
jgi:membrane-associated phospholipid phosphatase